MAMDTNESLEQEPRAEEHIISIYAQFRELRSNGDVPTRVIMSVDTYRVIQDYRSRLGELPQQEQDYLGKYELFGLPVMIDAVEGCRVEA